MKRPWPSLDRARGELGLSDEFRTWVVENALAGVPIAELERTLVEGGVPLGVARREVRLLVGSPALSAARSFAARARRAEMVLELRARLARESGAPIVARRTVPDAAEFFDRYFAANRPVIFTDATEGWPARAWTPESLGERLRGVTIEIASGRDGDPTPDRRLDAHREKTTFDEYVRRVRAAGTSNDVYMVANNKNMDRPELRALVADVRIDERLFDPERAAGGFSFWLGPAGTVTPLHHDTTNILFHQLYGRKRFILVAPEATALLEQSEGFYNGLDAEDGSLEEAVGPEALHEVELQPGESLFLPVGWWHHVRALDVSISLAQLFFRRPNAFDEYRPGH